MKGRGRKCRLWRRRNGSKRLRGRVEDDGGLGGEGTVGGDVEEGGGFGGEGDGHVRAGAGGVVEAEGLREDAFRGCGLGSCLWHGAIRGSYRSRKAVDVGGLCVLHT